MIIFKVISIEVDLDKQLVVSCKIIYKWTHKMRYFYLDKSCFNFSRTHIVYILDQRKHDSMVN